MSQHLHAPQKLSYAFLFQTHPSCLAEVSSDSAPQLGHICVTFSNVELSAFLETLKFVITHTHTSR